MEVNEPALVARCDALRQPVTDLTLSGIQAVMDPKAGDGGREKGDWLDEHLADMGHTPEFGHGVAIGDGVVR